MDLKGAHKEDSTVASSGSRCQALCMNNHHLLFQLVSFLWSTPLNIVYLVLIDIIVPDRRSRDLEVVVVRRIINLGTGNLGWGGNGKGLRKGWSVCK
jgi:hypothetical protein